MIQTLARMLGLSTTDAEASIHSERAARAVLTRRDLFAAGTAMATGAAFSFGAPESVGTWVHNPKLSWRDITVSFGEPCFPIISGLEPFSLRLGDLPARVVAVDGERVTRTLAGPAGVEITVTDQEDLGDDTPRYELEITRDIFPTLRNRARG